MTGYKGLSIYQKAFTLSIKTHHKSLNLPKFELYEQGSQLRRSSKSVKSNIVEGYGRKKYTKDYIKFLVYAQASCDETIDHLETIKQTHPNISFDNLEEEYKVLGKMINKFIQSIETRIRK